MMYNSNSMKSEKNIASTELSSMSSSSSSSSSSSERLLNDNNDNHSSMNKIIDCSSNSNNHYIVDMRSDTMTTPTSEMRKSMFEAIVGDDVYGEDPTVHELERKSAELFEKEDSLFVPSGTMANLLAIMVHCNRRGTEAIAGDLSHAFLYEQGSAAQIGGVQLSTIENLPDGTFDLNKLEKRVRGHDYHEPITKLVIIENTHNMCGGTVLPLEWIEKLGKLCKKYSLRLHMDGARVFNASEAISVPVSTIAKYCDSICFCLSKGLSCPVGSVLVGSKDFIKEARRLRKALGGGMRQAGVLAGPGLVALKTIVPRLKEDHLKIQKIAKAIHNLQSPNIKVNIDKVQTNILLLFITGNKLNAETLSNRLVQITQKEIEDGITDNDGKGIILKVSSRDWQYARIVSYQQITEMDIEFAIKKLNYVIREFDNLLK